MRGLLSFTKEIPYILSSLEVLKIPQYIIVTFISDQERGLISFLSLVAINYTKLYLAIKV